MIRVHLITMFFMFTLYITCNSEEDDDNIQLDYLVRKSCNHRDELAIPHYEGCRVSFVPFLHDIDYEHNSVDCSGEFPILKYDPNCPYLPETEEDDLPLNSSCPNDEFYCTDEFGDEPNTCVEILELLMPFPIFIYKTYMGDCSAKLSRILSDGDDIYIVNYLDVDCSVIESIYKLKNGETYEDGIRCKCNIDTSIAKYRSKIHYNNNGIIEYIEGTNNFECLEKTGYICYDNQLLKVISYSDDECKLNPNFSHFTINECDEKGICNHCSNMLPIIDQSIVAHYYDSEDDCLNDQFKTFNIYTPIINSCEKDDSIYLKHENKSHFNLIEYSPQSCDILESKSLQHGRCYHLSSLNKYIKARINFIINMPEEFYCEYTCSLNSTVKVNETIYVNIELILDEESNVIITLGITEDAVFEIGENGNIVIEDGTLTLDIETEEDFILLLENIRSNSSFEIVIIDGKYEGSFKNVNIEVPDDTDYCEKIIASIKEYPNKLTMVFSIDDSECSEGIKWWVILLICEGIVFLLMIVSIILFFTVKPIRSYVLPYKGS